MNRGLQVMGNTRHKSSGPSTPTFIASIMAANGVGSNSVTGASGGASSINTTGATLLCAVIIAHNAGTPTMSISDSKSNTWTITAPVQVTTDIWASVAYVLSPSSVGSGHTFTSSSPASYTAVFAFGTSTGWTFDQKSTSGSSANSPQTTPSITPALANEVIIAGFGDFNAIVTGTVNNSFAGGQGVGSTNFIPQNLSGSPCVGGAAYLIDSSTSSINVTFTFTPSTSGFSYGSIIAAFKHT